MEHVTAQEIYYSKSKKGEISIIQYKIKQKETIPLFSFIGDKNSIEFYNNWIEYNTSDGKKLYSLSDLKEYEYSNNFIQKEVSTYDCSDNVITNIITGEKKYIEFNESSKIFDTPQAEEMKQLGAYFDLRFVKIHDKKIYVVVQNDYFVYSVYLYDFETENFTYLDWNKNTNGAVQLFILD